MVNLRKEPYDVYIGRAGKGETGYFGNPFHLKNWGDENERKLVLEKYRKYFLDRVQKDKEFREEVLKLKGKRLGCFCKPKQCHGDVMAEWIDKR